MISVAKKYALLVVTFGAFGSVFGAGSPSDCSLEAKKAEIARLVASLGDGKRFFEERVLPTLQRNLSNRKYGEFIYCLVAASPSIDIEILRGLAKARLELAKKLQKEALAATLPKLSDYGFMRDADCLKIEGIWGRDLSNIVKAVELAVKKCSEVTDILVKVDSSLGLREALEEIENESVAAINMAEVLFEELKSTFTFFQKGVDAASLKACVNCSKKPEGAEVFSVCGQCRSVFYCSSRCQRTHWKAGHKAECKNCSA